MVGTKKKSNVKYIIVITCVSVVVSILVAVFVIKPLYNNIRLTNLELNEKKEVLAVLEKNLETLKKLEEKKAELISQNKLVLSAIPKDKDIARLFVQFQGIAASSNVKIETVTEESAVAEASEEKITPVTYRVTATTSSYDNLKTMLGKIESSLRILSASDVVVNRQEDGQLEITLTINTYKRGEQL